MSEWRRQGDTLSAKEALSANGETYACQQVNSAFQVAPPRPARILAALLFGAGRLTSFACPSPALSSCLQKWTRTELTSISAAPQDNNKFVWNVTIIGDLEGSWYENGIYHLTLTFPPDFPESLPRPQFKTKMFHPQINEDGYPYLSVSMADSKVSASFFARARHVGNASQRAEAAPAARATPAFFRRPLLSCRCVAAGG